MSRMCRMIVGAWIVIFFVCTIGLVDFFNRIGPSKASLFNYQKQQERIRQQNNPFWMKEQSCLKFIEALHQQKKALERSFTRKKENATVNSSQPLLPLLSEKMNATSNRTRSNTSAMTPQMSSRTNTTTIAWTDPTQVPVWLFEKNPQKGCTLVHVYANGCSQVIQGIGLPHTIHLTKFQQLLRDTVVHMKKSFSSSFRIFIDTADTSSCKEGSYMKPRGYGSLSLPHIFPFAITGTSFQPLASTSIALPLHKHHTNMENILKFVDPTYFNQKKDKAVWHGVHSGYLAWTQEFAPHMTQTPREKIVAIATHHSNLLEATFKKVPWRQMTAFKYIVAVSGNCEFVFTCSRLGWFLHPQ